MNKFSSYGTIKDGVITVSNKKRFIQDCGQFKDCEVEIIVKKKGTRSTQQNRYYFGVVVAEVRLGLKEIGYDMTVDETHYFLKNKFHIVSIGNKDGVEIQVPGSTTDMNTIEFMEYFSKIQQWGAEYLGINIPDPNQDLSFFVTVHDPEVNVKVVEKLNF